MCGGTLRGDVLLREEVVLDEHRRLVADGGDELEVGADAPGEKVDRSGLRKADRVGNRVRAGVRRRASATASP